MELFQILDCSSIGSCCRDYSLVVILDIMRKIFDLIQLIVPIVLIVAATIQFVQLTINPELKDGFRKVLNKVMAAVIIFLLPTLVDIVFQSVLPDTITVASCWNEAKVVAEEIGFNSGNYIQEEESSIWIKPIDFTSSSGSSNTGSTSSSSTIANKNGRAIVNYANQFVGKSYLWGGSWNGEIPYKPTDCSGFVRGVYLHFGVSLPHGTNLLWNNRSLYTLVSENDIQPGDVVMYDGHTGILTGNGNEIIHAKGKKWGVVKDSNYKGCSGHKILGILRIKGV